MTLVNRKCVFFDRDGIINRSPGPGYVERIEDFFLLPEFVAALRVVKEKQWLAVVITNQRGVSRGILSAETVEDIHDYLQSQLKGQGLSMDAVYYCPHNHNECDCRKPQPGMLIQAAQDLQIDLAQSWMIGDSESDVEAGHRAGCRAIRVHPKAVGSHAEHVLANMTELSYLLQHILSCNSPL